MLVNKNGFRSPPNPVEMIHEKAYLCISVGSPPHTQSPPHTLRSVNSPLVFTVYTAEKPYLHPKVITIDLGWSTFSLA